jgi:hypothetical protein
VPNNGYKHTTKVMDLEGRKNNTYFDQTGKQILVGDLLKVFHFRSNNRNYYMYQTVVMEETEPFPVMAIRAHFNDKPHCRMYVVSDNEYRAYLDAKIISIKDFQTKRQKIKVT